jgi:spore photoproduct lyase
MNEPSITRFLVDRSIENRENTRRLLAARPDVPVHILEEGQEPREFLKKGNFNADKTVYHLTRPKGRHFKKCPGITDQYVCCNLHVLDQAENCPLACSYCFLQTYLTDFISVQYMDYEPLFDEIRAGTAAQPGKLFRVGTGELSDSLALDHLTGFSRQIVPFAATLSNLVLELKTKSDRVDNLLDLDHKGHTVVAWSVNPPEVNKREEPGCAPLSERLRAARRVVEAGYPVAFHFDPMLHYEGCYEEYAALVEEIFRAVPAERVAWISIGSVRFQSDMKQSSMEKFPKSQVMLGEIVRGFDGKMRYIKPIRHKLYDTVLDAIRKAGGQDVFSYFCMENAETWQKFMGHVPQSNPHLDYLFAENLCRRFTGLLPHPPKQEDFEEPPAAVKITTPIR